MQYIFVVLCFFGAVAAMLFVKSLNLSGGLTAVIIIPLVLLVIYSMARLQPKESETANQPAKQ